MCYCNIYGTIKKAKHLNSLFLFNLKNMVCSLLGDKHTYKVYSDKPTALIKTGKYKFNTLITYFLGFSSVKLKKNL